MLRKKHPTRQQQVIFHKWDQMSWKWHLKKKQKNSVNNIAVQYPHSCSWQGWKESHHFADVPLECNSWTINHTYMLRYTLVVKELLCGATMETETPQNRSRAVEFLTACLSYSIGDTYQVGAQFWGNERCGSINLQISSMWRSSCLPSSLPITPLNTIIQRGGGGEEKH